MEGMTSSSTFMGNREIEVCQTLLKLKNLIPKFEILRNLNWGIKKLRSCKHTIPNPNPLLHLGFIYKEKERKEVLSPKSPLSLSDCEPNYRQKKPHGKNSKKRTIEELLEMVEKLEQNREVLRREVGKVKCYRSKLRAFNLELKATKKQMWPGALFATSNQN